MHIVTINSKVNSNDIFLVADLHLAIKYPILTALLVLGSSERKSGIYSVISPHLSRFRTRLNTPVSRFAPARASFIRLISIPPDDVTRYQKLGARKTRFEALKGIIVPLHQRGFQIKYL